MNGQKVYLNNICCIGNARVEHSIKSTPVHTKDLKRRRRRINKKSLVYCAPRNVG